MKKYLVMLALITSVLAVWVPAPASSANVLTAIAGKGPSVFVAWPMSKVALPGIGFRRSLDGGRTWKPEQTLVPSLEVNQVSIAVAPPNVYMALTSYLPTGRPAVFLLKSTDRGATWSDPLMLGTSQTLVWSPVIVASGTSRLIVVYNYWDFSMRQYVIGQSTSYDAGRTWSSKIISSADCYSYGPTVAADRQTLCLSWMDVYVRGLVHARSMDWGANWVRHPEPSTGRIFPAAETGLGIFGLAYMKSVGGETHCFFSRSPDGIEWSPEVQLSSFEVKADQGPSLVHSGSTVCVLWDADRLRFARSQDLGLTWKPASALSPTGQDTRGSSMAADGPNVYVSWADFIQDIRLDFYVRVSKDKGATWDPPRKIGTLNY